LWLLRHTPAPEPLAIVAVFASQVWNSIVPADEPAIVWDDEERWAERFG
jgi:hypothetical protein